jgi:hypothetical protein
MSVTDYDCCETCRFFDAVNDEVGKCHRYAPRPSLSVISSGVAWPVVRVTDFCGEFMLSVQAALGER